MMTLQRFLIRSSVAAAVSSFLSLAPIGAVVPKAHAQEVQVSAEFRTALEPYGEWRRSSRWGEVWAPSRVGGGWRPYTRGRWAYTHDWGWYWEASSEEADWGWVAYHYGRWVLDPELGWVWVPGREWAPAWVVWRRGHHHIGWAPLPPEEIDVEYREEPQAWIFVDADEFTAPDVASYVIPFREETEFLRTTVVENETVFTERDRGFAVNPGIAPDVVAAISGRPLHAYHVRPLVLSGTARIPNAVEVQPQQLREGRARIREARVEQTQTTIRPAAHVPEPTPLKPGERGRLTGIPPRAAQQAVPSERGKAFEERQKAEQERAQRTGRGRVLEERQKAEQERAQRTERGRALEERQKAEQERAQRAERGKALEERRKSEQERAQRAERGKALEERRRSEEERSLRASRGKNLEQRGRTPELGTRSEERANRGRNLEERGRSIEPSRRSEPERGRAEQRGGGLQERQQRQAIQRGRPQE